MASDAAAFAIRTASVSDQPFASVAHITPVWQAPADRVCTPFVGNPSICSTSPPGLRTQAPRDPARTTSGARSVLPSASHSVFIAWSKPPPTVSTMSSSIGTPSRSASVVAS